MLQAILPFPFVPISVLPLVHSVPRGFVLSPLSNVAIPKDALPDALTFFEPRGPFSLVHLPISPGVDALSVGLSRQEFALISIAIRVPFHAPARSRIGLPLALVDSSFAVLHHTEAVAFPVYQLTSIYGLIVVLHAEFRGL